MLGMNAANVFGAEPVRLSTPGFDCFSVKFDPFNGRFLACATSANFGMKGAGRLWLIEHQQQSAAPQIYDVPEGLYDITWSESNPRIVAAAQADGAVVVFDTKLAGIPTLRWKEHSRECNCVEWNAVQKDLLLSAAFDGAGSIKTLNGHEGLVYQASWSPREANVIISVGSDRSIRLWDYRSPTGLVKTMPKAHENDILTVDWNKWNPIQFATGSVDATVRIWDWRMPHSPTCNLRGHHRTVRKVRWSPFSAEQLFSVGYDMTMRAWDVRSLNPMVGAWEGHSEFVTGLDVSLHDPSLLVATCAWDQSVYLLRPINWGHHTPA